MLKVNEEKILQDIDILRNKKSENLAKIEADVKTVAISRNYDEDKMAKLISYAQELEGNGLSNEDNAKLVILENYIEEVTEQPIDEVVTDSVVAEITNL